MSDNNIAIEEISEIRANQKRDGSSGVDNRHGRGVRSNSVTGSNSENISNSLTVAAILSGTTTADYRSALSEERENASQQLSVAG